MASGLYIRLVSIDPALSLAAARTNGRRRRAAILEGGFDPRIAMTGRGTAEMTFGDLVTRYLADPPRRHGAHALANGPTASRLTSLPIIGADQSSAKLNPPMFAIALDVVMQTAARERKRGHLHKDISAVLLALGRRQGISSPQPD